MLGSAFAADELVPAALTETASVPMHRYLASEPSAPRNMPMPRQPSMPASSGCSACSSSQDSALPGTTETNSAISRAAGDSLSARASTASRTVAGSAADAGVQARRRGK